MDSKQDTGRATGLYWWDLRPYDACRVSETPGGSTSYRAPRCGVKLYVEIFDHVHWPPSWASGSDTPDGLGFPLPGSIVPSVRLFSLHIKPCFGCPCLVSKIPFSSSVYPTWSTLNPPHIYSSSVDHQLIAHLQHVGSAGGSRGAEGGHYEVERVGRESDGTRIYG